MKNTKKQVGRPVEKIGRTKIGLSISGEASKMLNELTKMTGKTKSRIFEEAIKVLKTREELIYERMKEYEKHGKDSLLDFDELLKNKLAVEKELEVKHVG